MPHDRAAKGRSFGALAEMAYPSSSSEPGSSTESDEPIKPEAGAFAAAADSLANTMNVPTAKRSSFRMALKEAIHACMKEGYEEE